MDKRKNIRKLTRVPYIPPQISELSAMHGRELSTVFDSLSRSLLLFR